MRLEVHSGSQDLWLRVPQAILVCLALSLGVRTLVGKEGECVHSSRLEPGC